MAPHARSSTSAPIKRASDRKISSQTTNRRKVDRLQNRLRDRKHAPARQQKKIEVATIKVLGQLRNGGKPGKASGRYSKKSTNKGLLQDLMDIENMVPAKDTDIDSRDYLSIYIDPVVAALNGSDDEAYGRSLKRLCQIQVDGRKGKNFKKPEGGDKEDESTSAPAEQKKTAPAAKKQNVSAKETASEIDLDDDEAVPERPPVPVLDLEWIDAMVKKWLNRAYEDIMDDIKQNMTMK